MKVAARTLGSVMGLVAHSLNDKKTVTLTPGQNAVTLTSTSGTGSTRARIIAVTEEDGDINTCSVSGPLLAALATTSTTDVIIIKPAAGANMLAASAGAANTSLSTSEPTDFPALDPTKAPADRTTFAIPLNVLAAGVGRVQYAAARKDDANPAHRMTQLLITPEGNLVTAGLNGRQLAYSTTSIPGWQGEPVNLLFPPTKALADLLNLAPDATAHVMIANSKILLAVKNETLAIEVVLNTVDLAYPDWQALTQQLKPTIVAVAKTKAMRDLLARGMAICPTQRVGLKLTGGKLVLGAKNETVQHVDAIDLDGGIKTIGSDGKAQDFSGEFTIFTAPSSVLDALNATLEWTTAETVRLGFIADTKPFVINPMGYTYNHWVWPMAATAANAATTPATAAA